MSNVTEHPSKKVAEFRIGVRANRYSHIMAIVADNCRHAGAPASVVDSCKLKAAEIFDQTGAAAFSIQQASKHMESLGYIRCYKTTTNTAE